MQLLKCKDIKSGDMPSTKKEEVITHNEWQKKLGSGYKYFVDAVKEYESLQKIIGLYVAATINGEERAIPYEDIQFVFENEHQDDDFYLFRNQEYRIFQLERTKPHYIILLQDKAITAEIVTLVTEGIRADDYRKWKKEHLRNVKGRLVFLSID